MSSGLYSSQISDDKLIFFCKDLSSLLTAGVALEAALYNISSSVSGKFSMAIKEIGQDVASGLTFSESLENFENIFTKLFIYSIKMAENTGNLDHQLMSIALQIEKERETRYTINNLLVYPRYVSYMCFLLMVVNLMLIIPTIKGFSPRIFNNVSGFSYYIFNLSELLMNNWKIYITIIFGFLILTEFVMNLRSVNIFIINFIGFFPGFRGVLKNSAISKFARALSLITNAGISIVTGVKTAGEISGNKAIQIASEKISYLLDNGYSLSDAFSSTNYFNNNFISMIYQAEKTGNYSGSFEQTAKYYEEKASESLNKLSHIMKPLLTIVIAFFLFFQLFMIFYPIIINIKKLI